MSTNQQTARKPISAGISTHGRNRSSNGRVIARVTRGSVKRIFQRSESSGLDHLAVRAAREPRAVLVARAADLTEQLEALRTREGARRVGCGGGRCGPRSGAGEGGAHPRAPRPLLRLLLDVGV